MVEGAGYAELALVPAARAVPVPEGVSLEKAAAVMLQGMTAHYLCESTFPARRTRAQAPPKRRLSVRTVAPISAVISATSCGVRSSWANVTATAATG